MNAKLNICTGLLFSSLALSAGPAGAVSPHSTWFKTVFNNHNTESPDLNMATHATHFCYLSKVGVENTDESGESATCSVTRQPGAGGVWILHANLGEPNDADVFCAAYCYNN